MNPRIPIIPGSRRTDSLNQALAHEVASRIDTYGGQADMVDMGWLALPIYDADDEATNGLPLLPEGIPRWCRTRERRNGGHVKRCRSGPKMVRV